MLTLVNLGPKLRVLQTEYQEQGLRNMRGMKMGLAIGSLVGVGAMCLSLPASAGELTGTVSLSAGTAQGVTLSVPPSEPVATYLVTVQNTQGGATIDRPKFHAETSVIGGEPSAIAQFKSSTGYTCTPTNVTRTAVTCDLDPLAPGVSSNEFTLTFSAPTSGTQIAMHWRTDFDSGGGLSNGNGDATPVTLLPRDKDKVQSDVPALTSLEFFTGGGVATKEDTWVTRVSIFTSSVATLATVQETQDALTDCVTGRAADLLTCSITTLSIPGATFGTPGQPIPGQFLKITLLRDVSTIARRADISTAKIYYIKDGQTGFTEVGDCALTGGPTTGAPCEDRTKRIAYPRRSAKNAPVPAGYEGDWSFTIYATDNGRYFN